MPGVCASVHEVELGEGCESAMAVRVHISGEFESIGGGDICVGGYDNEDDGGGVFDVPVAHIDGELFYIRVLFMHSNASDAGEVDQRQIGTEARVDGQEDRIIHDLLVLSSHFVSLFDDAPPYLVEVVYLLSISHPEYSVSFTFLVLVHQSQLQRSSSHHSTPSRQKVHSHHRLQ